MHGMGNVLFINLYFIFSKIPGKSIPEKAWTNPEGSRNLRLSDFKTVGI
jgi:hypothetical protein